MQAAAGPDAEPDLGEPDAIARATASDPKDLSRAQAAVALWLSRRYHVAPEPVSRLVQEAWTVGALVDLDPTLILAVMAVESSFNPFAQSPVGAQGLMQVMTKVHDDKYEAFGGSHAAFDPVTNLRVGVQVLKECIAPHRQPRGGPALLRRRRQLGRGRRLRRQGAGPAEHPAPGGERRQGPDDGSRDAAGGEGARAADARRRRRRPSRQRPRRPTRRPRPTRSPCSTDRRATRGAARAAHAPLHWHRRATGDAAPAGARGGSPPGSTVGTCVARVGRAVRLGRPASRRIRFARIALKDGLPCSIAATSTLAHVDPEIAAVIARREPAPGRAHRAHRLGELRLAGGDGGAGQPAHQQVRRGLPRQALLRRLRVRRHGRAARDRPRQAAVRRRLRQRAGRTPARRPTRRCSSA